MIPEADPKQTLRAFATTYFVVLMGFSLWRMTFYNYALDTFQLSPREIGNLFAIASVPGTVAFLVAVLEYRVNFRVVTWVATGLLGAGLVLLGVTARPGDLWGGILLLNAGVVWFLPLANKSVLVVHSERATPRALGRLKSLGPAAAVVAAGLVWAVRPDAGTTGTLLLAAGVCAVVLGLWCANRSRGLSLVGVSTRLRLTTLLWPYYLLNFLSGCRSAVFKTYIISQLVTVYQLPVMWVSLAIVASAAASMAGYRLLGHLGSVLGPVRVLGGLYLAVAALFCGFAITDSLALFCVLFLLDALLFGSSVLTDSYLKGAVPGQHLTGDLSVGLSLFHLGIVTVPLIVGWIWTDTDLTLPILVGAGVCLLAFVVSRSLGRRRD